MLFVHRGSPDKNKHVSDQTIFPDDTYNTDNTDDTDDTDDSYDAHNTGDTEYTFGILLVYFLEYFWDTFGILLGYF